MEQTNIRLRHGDIVVVADGRKALLLRNGADAAHPDLRTEQVLENDVSLPTRALADDRPGHFNKGSRDRRGAFAAPDVHEEAEEAFAKQLAVALDALVRSGEGRIVLISPPRMLGRLRRHLPPSVRGAVAAELGRDLVNLPVDDIAAQLAWR